MKKLLSDYTEEEIIALCAEMNLPKFRANQLFKWVSTGVDFSEMTNIPKEIRNRFEADFLPKGVFFEKTYKSTDGTVKFLFRLRDGNLIEGVLMAYKHGHTLCVSTQVGCRMGCVFCASGTDGLKRNLSAGEILGQIICANSYLKETDDLPRVSNVVLMGSGEPMDNYENVVKFIRLSFQYLNIGQRSISVSTCGFPDKIRQLADDGFSVTLCISLHMTEDEKRKKIMPIAKKYPISEIISAAKYYFSKSGRRIIFEYAMIQGENISKEDAQRLRRLTSDFPSHINLIPLNKTNNGLLGVNRRDAAQFCRLLENLGASATVRRSLGSDIEGACGQLRNKFVGDNAPPYIVIKSLKNHNM